jgi:hypothetical protein
MVIRLVMAIMIIAMKPASLPKMMEKMINPTKESPIAPAAKVRNLHLIPINSSGFCSPLNTG